MCGRADCDGAELVAGVESYHPRSQPDLNVRQIAEPTDEVLRHRLGETGTTHEQGDLLGVLGEADDGLAGRVAAADHDNPGISARERLTGSGSVVDACTQEVIN